MKAVPGQNADMLALGVCFMAGALVLSIANVLLGLPAVQSLAGDVTNYIWSQVQCGLPPEAPFR